MARDADSRTPGRGRWIGLGLGPLLFAACLLLPTPADLSPLAWKVAAVALLMVCWWVSEAIPIPATSMLPLVAFPLLGVMKSEDVAPCYADHNIFLFMGGFLIALAMEKWGLHRRIALHTIRLFGSRRQDGWQASMPLLVLGFMCAAALLSMWVSNTATTLMMLPIATAVLGGFDDHPAGDRLATALLLGIAYAASAGGIGTLIGTPPNIVLAGDVKKLLQVEIGFGQWMLLGVPLVVLLVPMIWLYLVRVAAPLPRGAGRIPVDLDAEIEALGPVTRGEWTVLAVFGLCAAAWILRRPLIGPLLPFVSDATIAMLAGLLLFVLPVDVRRGRFALDWPQALQLPWGVLLLFGGGFALAAGMEQSGLAAWLSQRLLVLAGLPVPLVVLATCLLMAGLTELTSNTATTIAMLPILAPAAKAMGIPPLTLMVPAAMAASCAFMLPAATPPNAIVFGTGRVRLAQMFRCGLALELVGAVLITLLVCTLSGWVFRAG
ncbi:MAG: DASS family sodium-coupled anion symporter [Deltaproteobacteria bacterium]|nr:DASS family sodium-coupled anion symporter [Deltaproteobacteria bacterium]